MTSIKLSKLSKTKQHCYSFRTANRETCHLRLAKTITVVLIFSSFLSVISSARLSTRNGLDTIKSLDNPEGLMHLHSFSLIKQKQVCREIYVNQHSPPPASAFSSASVVDSSTKSTYTTTAKLIKRTVNVNLKWGNKRYKCNFMYYDGCESKCRKIDQCLKDQGFNVGYSICVNKKKEATLNKSSQENNSNSSNNRYTRRILRRKIRHREIRN